MKHPDRKPVLILLNNNINLRRGQTLTQEASELLQSQSDTLLSLTQVRKQSVILASKPKMKKYNSSEDYRLHSVLVFHDGLSVRLEHHGAIKSWSGDSTGLTSVIIRLNLFGLTWMLVSRCLGSCCCVLVYNSGSSASGLPQCCVTIGEVGKCPRSLYSAPDHRKQERRPSLFQTTKIDQHCIITSLVH